MIRNEKGQFVKNPSTKEAKEAATVDYEAKIKAVEAELLALKQEKAYTEAIAKRGAAECRKQAAQEIDELYTAITKARNTYKSIAAEATAAYKKAVDSAKVDYTKSLAAAKKPVTDACTAYNDALTAFIKKYGSYHKSIRETDKNGNTFTAEYEFGDANSDADLLSSLLKIANDTFGDFFDKRFFW